MAAALISAAVLLSWCSFAQASDIGTVSGVHTPSGGTTEPTATPNSDHRSAVAYAALPLIFEANQGQTGRDVKFLSRGSGYSLFLTPAEAVLALSKPDGKGTVVRTKLLGSRPSPRVTGLEELPGKVNYFIGNDPTLWRANLPTYAKVKYESVYPGIDLVYYGSQRTLEYDFVVAPGADPKAIRLTFEGAETLAVNAQGDLVLKTASGEVRLRKPLVYQEVDSQRTPVAADYILKSKTQIGFRVAAYDVKKPLVIDPVLAYSTYLGGSGVDQAFGIAVDSSGNAYVTGATQSANFPAVPKPGVFDSKIGGNTDAFVTKLDSSGVVVYSTYLGGGSPDSGAAIAVDCSGNAHVTGQTQSANFPVTFGAFEGVNGGSTDAFVTVLNAAGSQLLYSSFLGGNSMDAGLGIAVVPASAPNCTPALFAATNIYVTGFTTSSNFPTTGGAADQTPDGGKDAFVARVNPAGKGSADLVYSTLLGGSGDDVGNAIAVAGGFIYVTGSTASADFPKTPRALDTSFNGGTDAFVSKLNPAGGGASDLVYSTFLGSTGNDAGNAIALDDSGNVYVTGSTTSPSSDFPTTAGAFQRISGGGQDAFVTKLNPNVAGSDGLLYSTYLGGSGTDVGNGIAVFAGTIFVTGSTGSLPNSLNFPPLGLVYGGGTSDAFVASLNPAGNGQSDLTFSILLGGSLADIGHAIAVDGSGSVYVAGETSSTNFPGPSIRPFGGATDAFVVMLSSKQRTTTQVSSSANPSSTGQSVTFTATISPSSATGTVQFTIDGSNFGNPVTVTSGIATSAGVSTLAAGSHTVTAVYSGDGNFLGSTGSLTQTVSQTVTTQTALTSSSNPSVSGQPVTFTATVTASSGTPTGTVTFNEGATTLGTGTLNASGQAAFTTSTLAVGAHSIKATYVPASGSNFSGSTSPALSQVVNLSSTTTAVTSSVNPSVFGQSVTFTATVSVVSPGAGTPTGTVTFKDGATTLGTGTLDGTGKATFTTSSLPAGAHSITAVYGGDSSFSTSTSSVLSQTVNQATTSTALASSSNPSGFGQSVTFTATVSVVAPGAGTPTGTVTFNDGATTLGTGTLDGTGSATFTTSSLSVGSRSITAVYGGDVNFSTSTSPVLSQTVSPPFGTIPDLTIVEPEPLLIGGVTPGVTLTVASSDETLINNLYISPAGSTRLFTYQRPVATQGASGAVTITVNAVAGSTTFAGTFTITLTPDNCPGVPNPNQSDVDNDGKGDVCDPEPNGFDAATFEGLDQQTVTASIVSVSSPPGGRANEGVFTQGDVFTVTVAVTFNPAAPGGPASYFAFLPSPYNIILKVLDSQNQVVVANHILEGPPVRIALTPTGDLAQITQSAQTFFAVVPFTDWHALSSGTYTIHADYVSEGVKDPQFDKGVCAAGAECFAPIWQGTAPASLTIAIGDQCPADNIPFGQGAGGTGCAFADKATVIHKSSASWGPLAGTAYPGVQVRVFDRNDPKFQAAYGKNPGQSQFKAIFEASIGLVGQCVTGPDGVAFCGENNKGNDLIVIKALDSANNFFYDGKPTTPIDFDNTGIAAKSFAVP